MNPKSFWHLNARKFLLGGRGMLTWLLDRDFDDLEIHVNPLPPNKKLYNPGSYFHKDFDDKQDN